MSSNNIRLLTVNDIAEILSISRPEAEKLMKTQIGAIQIGGEWRVREEAFDTYLDNNIVKQDKEATDKKALEEAEARRQEEEAARSSNVLLIKGNAGIRNWLARRGIRPAEIFGRDPRIDDVKGRHVIGLVHFYLAAEAESVSVIRVPKRPLNWKGRDLTVDELEACEARLETYITERVETPFLNGNNKP